MIVLFNPDVRFAVGEPPDTSNIAERSAILHSDGRLYLERFHVSEALRLHRWWGSDDQRAMHDHPWDNQTLVLTGRLLEVTLAGSRLLEPGAVVDRLASEPHRIELVDDEPVWTVFTVGPVRRRWGFHTSRGWVYWKRWPYAGRVA